MLPFDPLDLNENQLKDMHRHSIDKAVELKMSELKDNDVSLWQALSIKNDPEGEKKKGLLKTQMQQLLEEVGIEMFMKTPAIFWEQCIINGLAAGENPGKLLEASFRSIIAAYSHPDSCETTRDLLGKLRGLARDVLLQQTCQCDKCRGGGDSGSPSATTVH